MFMMIYTYFKLLCQRVTLYASESQFRSKACIDIFLKDQSPIYDANIITTSGFISGEVKMVITL